MTTRLIILVLFGLLLGAACKKDDKGIDCLPTSPTIRTIVNKQAVVKLTATISGVFLVEQGTIDTRLIPCNLPMDFYQNDLQVVISGEVKATVSTSQLCCTENIYLTKISR